jgi:hypothetical protein
MIVYQCNTQIIRVVECIRIGKIKSLLDYLCCFSHFAYLNHGVVLTTNKENSASCWSYLFVHLMIIIMMIKNVLMLKLELNLI